jgi:hypothetical protein
LMMWMLGAESTLPISWQSVTSIIFHRHVESLMNSFSKRNCNSLICWTVFAGW